MSDEALRARARVVLVIGEGRVETHALPDGASLVFGRDAGCSVPLHHTKISRRHAALHAGPPLALEDLGSTNGVRIAGQRIAPGARVAIEPGAFVELGPFVAVVLDVPNASTADVPRHAALTVTDPTPAGLPELAARIARSAISVLILGETGTGKDVLARTVHALSGRTGQLVCVNCAALSEALLESELFGHERGAFTGASAAKPGLFEVARGGTVFLDEIGELPLALQGKLLRALEAREVYRIGGTQPTKLDVRFVSATHRDLAAEIAAGRFRHDFWFRINGITLTVPPLRERRAQIPALAERLLGDVAHAHGRGPLRLSSSAVAALMRHDWPGNVRELRTVMERAVTLSAAAEIDASDIFIDRMPSPLPGQTSTTASRGSGEAGASAADPASGKARLVAAVAAHRGNVTSVARELGTSRSQVRRLARRFGIDLDRFR